MSLTELDTWVAWIQFQNDQMRKAQKRGKGSMGSKVMRGGSRGQRRR